MDQTRIIECACGADVSVPIQYGFEKQPRWRCGKCGYGPNHEEAVSYANGRLTVEEASAIALKYTFDQIMEIARRGYAGGSLTSEEMDAVAASVLLRSLGLPSHAQESQQHH